MFNYRFLFSIMVAAAIILYLGFSTQVSFQVIGSLFGAEYFYIAICGAMFLFALALFVRSVRWSFLLDRPKYFFVDECHQIYLLSFFLGAITPFRSGELLKVGWLKSKNISIIYGIGALATERFQDLALIALCFLALVNVSAELNFFNRGWGYLLTALALTVYVGVLFLSPWLSKMLPVGLKILDGFPKVKKSYLSLIDGLLLLSNVRKKIIFLIFGLLIWFLHFAAVTWFFMLVAPTLPWYAGPVFLITTNFTGILNLTPGNVGLFEVTGVLILSQFGMNSDKAMAITMTFHFGILSLVTIVGMLSWLLLLRDRKTVKLP